MMSRFSFFCLAMAALALASCTSSREVSKDVKIGKPYVVGGKLYTPKREDDYDKVGLASWYGPGFHGGRTANGERFDQDDMTAAHPTLPMPSLVRVTNLANGRSAIIRVNDRGPFAKERIIDLSRAAAKKLGIGGVSQVRVQYLRRASELYLSHIRTDGIDDGHNYERFLIAEREPEPPPPQAMPEAHENRSFGLMHDAEAAEPETAQNAPIAPVTQVETVESPPMEPTSVEQVNARGMHITVKKYAPHAAPAPIAAPKKAATAAAQPAPVVLQPMEAAPAAAAPAAASKPVVAGARKKLFIQAGSFAVIENAHKLAEKIGSVGEADIKETTVHDKLWYRVRLGPMASEEEALNVLHQLLALGINEAKITNN